MTILTLATEATGFGDLKPRIGHMESTDILATITTAGYINNSPQGNGINFSNGDILAVKYNNGSGGTTSGWFQVTIPSNSTIITLSTSMLDVPTYVQGITAGTSAASKALVLNSSSQIDGVAISAIEHAGTLCASVTAGTSAASKVLSLDSSSQLNSVAIADITSAGTYVNGLTAGTPAASRALTLSASSQLSGVAIANITAAGTYNAALTATVAEANLNHLQVASITTVSTTPASGSCAVQFQFNNAAAGAIAATTPMIMYTSDVNGVAGGAVTSNAALTNGTVTELIIGSVDLVTSTAAGLLGVTVTAAAGTYYLSFILPNGKHATSGAIVVNA